MKNLLLLLLCLISFQSHADDDAKKLIKELNKKFYALNDYTASIFMKFDIPGVKMNSMHGKVFFKKPNKFRIRTKGIFFLPKQNPMQNVSNMFLDTSAYTTVISGYEVIDNRKCAIINMIPLNNENELILGKFWVDVSNPLVIKSQITTKNNGTIETQNYFDEMVQYALPSKIVINIETNKMKMPKMMAMDLKKKSSDKSKLNMKEKGTIELNFSNFKINTKFPDQVFTEKDE
jgi:outer membrane lipoprotein-sorting protein